MPRIQGFNFTTSKFFIEFNTQKHVSPLSRATQRILLPGARWKATYSLPRMKRIHAARWQGFFDKLQGLKGEFKAFDPEGATPQGVATGAPLVLGSGQEGNTLATDGWTPNVDNILKAGDYFCVNNELKRVVDDAISDGAGIATLNFEPALRASPGDNEDIVLNNNVVDMIMTRDVSADFRTDENGVYQTLSFSAEEPLAV